MQSQLDKKVFIPEVVAPLYKFSDYFLPGDIIYFHDNKDVQFRYTGEELIGIDNNYAITQPTLDRTIERFTLENIHKIYSEDELNYKNGKY